MTRKVGGGRRVSAKVLKGYEAAIKAMSPAARKALLEGDWSVEPPKRRKRPR